MNIVQELLKIIKKINDSYSKDKTMDIDENNLKLFYKDHQVCVNYRRKGNKAQVFRR